MAGQIRLKELNARQRAAYPHIVRGVREGLTQARIEAALRKENMGIAHGVMRALIRHERAVFDYGTTLRQLRPGDRPVARNLPQALTKMLRRYAFTVEVRGTMAQTGKPVTQHVTLSMDRLMSRAQMEEMARDLVGSQKRRYGIEVEDAVISTGLRAGEEGIL